MPSARAGRFDGTAGVVAAVECVETLVEHDVETRHPLELVVFADEEHSMVGSRGLAGLVSPDVLAVANASGHTVRDGLRRLGGDPARLADAARTPGEIATYLELHVEQGDVLHRRGIPIGVVEGIVGVYWWERTVEGFANHAGTTPMVGRRDALVAASRFVLAVNRIVVDGRALLRLDREIDD